MADRAGKPAFNILMTCVCFALAAAFVWWMLPDWIARPYAEATTGQYQDAADLQGTDYSTGKCPALRMAAAKALADKKLTAGEARSLRNQAYELAKVGTRNSAKNRALEAAGQKPTEQAIDCPYGLSLFVF